MGNIIETKINKFNGGMVNDPRDPTENTCRVVTNFDVLTNSYKMSPYRSSESGDSAASTSRKQNFCVALRTGTTYRLFGLGVVSGTARAEILMKDLTTGAATDLDDADWATPANNQSSAGTTSFNLFVYYKKVGRIFGAKAGTTIWVFDPASSAAFLEDGTGNSRSLTYTNIAQGLVHSKDDILYIPYDNKIAKNDNGTWSDTALTLPSHLYITSICEDGNNLVIACAPLSGVGDSVVFIWDRDSSLATLSDSINWGQETLKIIESVEGIIIGISLSGTNSTRFKDRIVFKYLSASNPITFQVFEGGTSTLLPIAKQKINDRLYFMMLVSLNGATREGVWSVGRNLSSFSIVHERTPNNNTALVGGDLYGFFLVGDFMFISYLSSSTYALSKTDDTETYSASSIYESKIFNAGDSSLTKKLIGVTVMTEPMPTAGQIILSYRKDGATAWTEIFTEATDSSISRSAINIESSGDNLGEHKEVEFQIKSTGGAVVTGFSFKEEFINKRLY